MRAARACAPHEFEARAGVSTHRRVAARRRRRRGREEAAASPWLVVLCEGIRRSRGADGQMVVRCGAVRRLYQDGRTADCRSEGLLWV